MSGFKTQGFQKKCNNSNMLIGTQVKIKKLKGDDAHLSGLTGSTTHAFSFGCQEKGWIGIYLDNKGKCNVREDEVEIIEDKMDFREKD